MASRRPDCGSDDLTTYLSFAAANPALFGNGPNGGIEILLDPADIRRVEIQVAADLAANGLPPAWARVGIVHEDQYSRLVRDAVRFPDGHLGTYIRLVDPAGAAPGVVILPLCEERVLLARHYRHATRQWHLEVPRGFGTAGEPSEIGARRELREEIGATPTRLIPLGPLHPNTGLDGGHADLFFAETVGYGHTETAAGIAAVVPTPIPALERLIADGDLTDGYTIAAFTRARLRGLL